MYRVLALLYGADSKKDSRERLSFLLLDGIIIFYIVKDNYSIPPCQG